MYFPRDDLGNFNPWELFKAEKLSYDRIFEFSELLEQDSFWNNLSLNEFNTLIDYCIWAMRFSVPENRPDLKEKAEKEISILIDIVNDTNSMPEFFLNQDYDFELQAATGHNSFHIIKCGWISDKLKKAKKWIKDNKGPLIICAVVATALVVGAVTGGIGAGSAAAVGGALAGGAMDDTPSSNHVNKPGEVVLEEQMTPPPPLIFPPIPIESELSQTLPHVENNYNSINETISVVKEELANDVVSSSLEEQEKTFWEGFKELSRETASYFAHEVLDNLVKIGEYLYEINPSASPEEYREYQELSIERHTVIDQIFGTDQSQNYGLEVKGQAKETLFPGMEMQTGVLPPPGGGLVGAGGKALANAAKTGGVVGTAALCAFLTNPSAPISSNSELTLEDLYNAGSEVDREGLTKAGRALAKHGGRPGSAFPQPNGSPEQINNQGQQVLESILTHPEVTIDYVDHPNFGEVLKIQVPGEGGVWYKADGEMIGFLEP